MLGGVDRYAALRICLVVLQKVMIKGARIISALERMNPLRHSVWLPKSIRVCLPVTLHTRFAAADQVSVRTCSCELANPWHFCIHIYCGVLSQVACMFCPHPVEDITR